MTSEEIDEMIEQWRNAPGKKPVTTGVELVALVRMAVEAERDAIAKVLDDREAHLRRHANVIGSTQWGTQAELFAQADELNVQSAAIRNRKEQR